MPILARVVANLAGVGLEMLVKGSLVLVVGLGIVVLLRRRHAALRHAVLTATLVGALLLPLLGHMLPPLWAPIPATRISSAAVGSSLSVSEAARNTSRVAAAASESRGVLPVQLLAPAGDFVLPLVIGIWTCGIIAALVRVAAGWLSTRRLIRSARRPDAGWETLTRHLAARLDVRRDVEVRQHDSLSIPVAAGAFSPVIVLPASAEFWSDARRRLVIAHELAHVRRYDCLIEYLAALACGVYWFHPLAWRLVARLRSERERSCDDIVLRLGTTAPDYAEHPVDLAAAARGASVGLYGVVSYSVGQRTGEIGVRLALGADAGRVRVLIVSEGARLALAGVAIGTVGALAATKVLRDMLFGVGPSDPVTFATAAIVLTGVAVIASYPPAYRASRIDPLTALRAE